MIRCQELGSLIAALGEHAEPFQSHLDAVTRLQGNCRDDHFSIRPKEMCLNRPLEFSSSAKTRNWDVAECCAR
jgi:hypothetical protein